MSRNDLDTFDCIILKLQIGRFEVAYNTATYLLSPLFSILSSIITTLATTISIFVAILRLIANWTLVVPWEAWRTFCQDYGYFGLMALFSTVAVVPFLPSWGRAAVEVAKEPEPLYILFVAGRDAIGRAPVATYHQF